MSQQGDIAHHSSMVADSLQSHYPPYTHCKMKIQPQEMQQSKINVAFPTILFLLPSMRVQHFYTNEKNDGKGHFVAVFLHQNWLYNFRINEKVKW